MNPNQKITPEAFLESFGGLTVKMPRSVLPKEKSDGSPAPQRGRPTNYTFEAVKEILTNLALAHPLKTAAEAVGLTEREIYRWMDQYEDFRQCVTRARADCESMLIKNVLAGGKRNPRLYLEVLERRHSRDWAQHKEVKHTGFVAHSAVGEIDLDKLAQGREGRDREVLEAEEIKPKELSEGVPPTVANIANTQDVVVEPADADTNKPTPLPLPSEVIDQQPIT